MITRRDRRRRFRRRFRPWAFFAEERGETHVGFSFLMITFAASIPLGMACIRLYDAMCAAGGAANLIIGLF